MLTREQRAHDIAVAILPDVIKENHWNYYEEDKDTNLIFNAPEITEEYYSIYEAILDQLPKD